MVTENSICLINTFIYVDKNFYRINISLFSKFKNAAKKNISWNIKKD